MNKVTPALFAAYPDARAMSQASPLDLEALINRIGMYRQKSKNLVALAGMLMEHHGGQVPRTLPELVELPGVGRKTANVVLGVMWGKPEGVVVDTHVQRVSQRLGWTRFTDPGDIELDLAKKLPEKGVGHDEPHAHLPRAAHLLRREAGLRRLRGERAVPERLPRGEGRAASRRDRRAVRRW